MTNFRKALALLFAALLAVAAIGCGGDDEGDGGEEGAAQETQSDVKGNLQVSAVWSGPEQESFQAVLDGFTKKFPNVKVRYNSAGDQLPTVLSTAVEGGNPPDLAVIAQPGTARDFARKGALKKIDFARDTIAENYNDDWLKLGTFEGGLYGLVFKGANKSTLWFNTQAFEDAGVEAPETYDEFIETAATIKDSGLPAHSVAGADGWTLTDLFENLYLRIAGPEKYDQLAEHKIKWTDPSVKETLREMAKIYGDSDNIAGGTKGALQTEFPDGAAAVLNTEPKAATFLEGDFVPGALGEDAGVTAGEDYDVAPFPKVGDGADAVMGGGDMVVMFKDSPASQELVKYLASPEAAEIWAKRGGFSSPNKNVDENVYPDDITRETATSLANAETFRFDMSDLAPASFGATPGAGEWKILQDFLRDPKDVNGTAAALEKAAARAFN